MISESDREEGKRIIIHSTPGPSLQCFPHVRKWAEKQIDSYVQISTIRQNSDFFPVQKHFYSQYSLSPLKQY